MMILNNYLKKIKYYKTLKYDWIAQDSIPVRYAFYDVTVPEIYEYNIEILGFNRLISEKKKGTSTFTNGSYMKGNRYKFKGIIDYYIFFKWFVKILLQLTFLLYNIIVCLRCYRFNCYVFSVGKLPTDNITKLS